MIPGECSGEVVYYNSILLASLTALAVWAGASCGKIPFHVFRAIPEGSFVFNS